MRQHTALQNILATALLSLALVACDSSKPKEAEAPKDEAATEAPAGNEAGTETNTEEESPIDMTALAAYKEKNEAYLAENATKEGVTVAESGLQYVVEKDGEGASPTAESYVVVHYAGRLIDGTEFDSSYKRGEPATFPAGRLIKGFTEALLMMKEGAKWQITIPAEIAYGNMDRGPIPANSTLIFDLELIKVTSEEELIADMKAPQEAYLAENAKKAGVTTTASGLQYKVVESGDGKSPTDTSTVVVHYAGRLIDGTEFDSSYKRGEPIDFPVNGVIPGWTEALLLMKEGDKWELTIPSDLGYGARGAGQDIPPYSTLVFDVELLEVR